MKTIKYTMSVWATLLLSVLFFACTDDFENGNNKGDGKSIRLTFSIPDNLVVNPMTKAADEVSPAVTDITVLVYNTNKELLASKYYESGSSDFEQLNAGNSFTTEAIEVGENASGVVYVVANAGDLSSISWSELENKKFSLSNGQPQMIMCASGDTYPNDPKQGTPSYSFSGIPFNVNTNSNITAELVRIYAKVTVAVEFKDMTNGVTITPQTLKIYNVPMTGKLKGPNKIISESGSLRDGELLYSTANDKQRGSWNSATGEGAVLYLYENMQPEGFCEMTNGKPDQRSKTPQSFVEATTNTELLKGDRLSSFIEIVAKYESTSSEQDGTIKYRFFLGNDAYKNFSVQRNVNYKVTLTLHKDGAIEEDSWRVETENIPNTINVSDVYISYLGNSSVEMKVTGDVNGIQNIEYGELSNPNPSDIGGRFDYADSSLDGVRILKFTANTTNIHDYKEKTMDVTFTMKNGKKYTATVHQVPRLVDPIAYYKSAKNTDLVKVEVKRFNGDVSSGKGRYEILGSKGPWTATISGGDWYTISSTDREQSVSGVNNFITGAGEVVFNYQPNSENTNADGDQGMTNGARFGKIIVKYHNNSCEHEIFLRQGYQPTVLGDGDYPWSSFNCLGKTTDDANAYGVNTTYPTQTGWLFNGGVDVAMNPYNPGYEVRPGENTNIEYSIGTQNYGYPEVASSSVYTNWQTRDDYWNSNNQNNFTINNNLPRTAKSKRGPCPRNYIVADAWSYERMVKKENNVAVYTGYVHDDSPSGSVDERGWDYLAMMNGQDPTIKPNNNCNPAKGSLFVNKNDNTNVFFGYGKGLIGGVGRDSKVLNEIGVGHRSAYGNIYSLFGILQYSESNTYGAYYWNATPFISGNMGKVALSYDIFSTEPNPIDVPGRFSFENGKNLAIGLDAFYNASFVRCVRDPNPDPVIEYVTFNLGKCFLKLQDANGNLTRVQPMNLMTIKAIGVTGDGSTKSVTVFAFGQNDAYNDDNLVLQKVEKYTITVPGGVPRDFTYGELVGYTQSGGDIIFVKK